MSTAGSRTSSSSAISSVRARARARAAACSTFSRASGSWSVRPISRHSAYFQSAPRRPPRASSSWPSTSSASRGAASGRRRRRAAATARRARRRACARRARAVCPARGRRRRRAGSAPRTPEARVLRALDEVVARVLELRAVVVEPPRERLPPRRAPRAPSRSTRRRRSLGRHRAAMAGARVERAQRHDRKGGRTVASVDQSNARNDMAKKARENRPPLEQFR